MEFRYRLSSVLQNLAVWAVLALFLLLWEEGRSYLSYLLPVAGASAVKEFQKLRQRVRVDRDGLTVGTTTLAWGAIRAVRIKGWGPLRYLEFDAGNKSKLAVYTSLENYEFFASYVQQWFTPQTERPQSLLA